MAATAQEQKNAKKVYDLMLKALNERNWHYKPHDEDLMIVSDYSGDDIPINFLIAIDASREVIRFAAPMPFKMSKEKRVDGAIAVAVANYGMVNGSFDYDINDGEIKFRLSTSYHDCEIGKGFFMNMLAVALTTVDNYNDKFMMLAKGVIDVEKFIKMENGEE